ncbi:hypothetical protein PACTADRAFT_46 [Pachysolen tannophilus NRRL Y-2460]|uniref:DNA damage-binding protein CMR1 n=1 Tax=Pachysolen tannophilus NRRL Y-2460 TaxID=669874 RepID=A0A1E4U0J3_PACTA|nr:hypothetical protein PACTADRAFT_46 [Pachysolen tannophilus NRRL Y-2460]
MGLSEFEKQRQANIARNKELLQKLNLNSISNDIYADIKKEENEKQATKRAKRPKKKTKQNEPQQPLRKSRRLAGVKTEDTEESQAFMKQLEDARAKKEELENLQKVRLSGDIKLIDVLSYNTKDDGNNDQIMLDKFAQIGKSISMGDFYEAVSAKTKLNDKNLDNLRKQFNGLKIFEKYDPLDVKITPNRMTSINFHPSITKRLVIGGDTSGHMGIWSIDDEKQKIDDQDKAVPNISSFKIHGKTISKCLINLQKSPSKIYTSSYDGSVRSVDLESAKSEDIFHLDDEYGQPVGISDANFADENLLYFTTLGGELGIKDLRVPDTTSVVGTRLLRLHDKKIGSFAINPSFNQQIATASLDRSLRLWDLRKITENNWSAYRENGESIKSPHCYGSYLSRLSISCADWNRSGDIVCNGYDDTVNIFNLGDTSNLESDFVYGAEARKRSSGSKKEEETNHADLQVPENLVPNHKIRHNCQTGRWVSILKSKWQLKPKDGIEKFAIANMTRYIDIYTASGIQVAHLGDRDLLGAVPAVVSFHPTENWIVGGSASGKGYLFC